MSVVINTNYASVLARKNLAEVQRQMDSSVERLSSGKRINNAADDAAGSAIAGRMESQVRGLTMGIRHAKAKIPPKKNCSYSRSWGFT